MKNNAYSTLRVDVRFITYSNPTLYANVISKEILKSMLYLFIKEVDAINNKLISMIRTR